MASGSASFWLTGWHRLYHYWDCYRYTNTLTAREREKLGYISKRFTLAEWRFHEAIKQNVKDEPRLGLARLLALQEA